MKCDKLLIDLQHFIITNLLQMDNVVHFLEESIEFQIPDLQEHCLKIIISNFKEIVALSPEFIYTLPQNVMVKILDDDDLNIN